MITSKLAEFVWSTSYDQLPEDVIEKAKECLTDFMGVALRGSQTKSGEVIKNIVKRSDESTVLGHGKSCVLGAGLANGVFAHSMDLDDGHRKAMLHPGACVIPAALSICEARDRSGKDLIESVVAGYHVAVAVGMMVNPEHRKMGFHSTGTCGTFGAAAAACKALDLNQSEIVNALGLAGTQAAGLLESDHSGSMGKHLHAGKAAQSGILSALLAKEGFTGSNTILEGNDGFIKSMSGVDPSTVALDLKGYKILDVYFKIYPVCRHLHSSIDALLQILEKNRVNPYEIEKITVNTYKIAAEHDDYHPTSTEAIRQSLPVSMAVTLLNYYSGTDSLFELNFSQINQTDVEDVTRKIFINIDPVFEENYPQTRPSEVSIFTKKDTHKIKVELPFGEPENPLKKTDIQWKFKKLNPTVDVKVLGLIEELDSYDSVRQFMDELNILC